MVRDRVKLPAVRVAHHVLPIACYAGVRDYAQVKSDGVVNQSVADAALNMLNVDAQGFDHMDRRLLLTLLEKYDGGPAGVESLAASIGEERDTIEDVLEPYLMQQGYITRTPRGRMATRQAYQHFGLGITKTFPQ